MYEEVGGFGHLLLFCFDYSENLGAGVAAFNATPLPLCPRVSCLCALAHTLQPCLEFFGQ